MLYRPSSFRKTAFALTTVAALAGVSAVAFPANAQQAVHYTGPAACAPFAGTNRETKCLIEQSQLRTRANEARGAAAAREGAAARAESAAAKGSAGCMDLVGKDIEAAKAKGPLTPDLKATFKARIEKCDRVS